MLRAILPLSVALTFLIAGPACAQRVDHDAAPASDFSAKDKGGGGGGKASRGGGGRGGGGGGGKAFRGGGGGGGFKAQRGGRGPRIERLQRGPQFRARPNRERRAIQARPRQERLRQNRRQEMRRLQSRQRQELRESGRDRATREALRARQLRERQELRAGQRETAGEQKLRRNQLTTEQRAKRLDARKQRLEQRAQRLREGPRRERRRVTADEARRLRFSAAFVQRSDRPARRAWLAGRRAGFVAWLGPVFLPYIFADLFDYTFFPFGYDRGYWAYAYDDFFDGIFFAYGSPYAPRGYATALPRSAGPAARQARAAVQQACAPDQLLSAWPFAQIERVVEPDSEQRKLLDQLRQAVSEATDSFSDSCRTDFAMTPPARLEAMLNRIEATLEALRIVRPPLEAFYASLTDEQKARFNEIGPKIGGAEAQTAGGAPPAERQTCDDMTGLANAPIDQIEEVVQPTEAQRDAFQKLSDASQSAVEVLQAACPYATPLTPPGRLDVMQRRLEALLEAAETVQPALQEFYTALSNEQKARFNQLGRQARRESSSR